MPRNKVNNDLKAVLGHLRTLRGFTYKDMEILTGFSGSFVRMYEDPSSAPANLTTRTMEKYAYALDVTFITSPEGTTVKDNRDGSIVLLNWRYPKS